MWRTVVDPKFYLNLVPGPKGGVLQYSQTFVSLPMERQGDLDELHTYDLSYAGTCPVSINK